MKKPDVVLRVQDLRKTFPASKRQSASLWDDIRSVLGGFTGNRQEARREFVALENVSFSVERGDILGIIGRNGAGKSTLLKIMSEIMAPTAGRIDLYGRVSSILEIGTGFHPDLTGRQNVFLNASLNGLNRETVAARFDEIVDFSGIGDAIDKPVKHYSSGMFLRLAFSVAFHSEVDILLLDEVLSVGDVEFRHKSTRRIQEIAEGGATIVLVSHELNAVREICNKVLLMENGRIKRFGLTQPLVEQYLEDFYHVFSEETAAKTRTDLEHPKVSFRSISIRASGKDEEVPILMEDAIEVEYTYVLKAPIPGLRTMIRIDHMDQKAIFDGTLFRQASEEVISGPGLYRTQVTIPAHTFYHGSFFLHVNIGTDHESMLELPYIGSFSVGLNEWEKDAYWNRDGFPYALRPRLTWETVRVE